MLDQQAVTQRDINSCLPSPPGQRIDSFFSPSMQSDTQCLVQSMGGLTLYLALCKHFACISSLTLKQPYKEVPYCHDLTEEEMEAQSMEVTCSGSH